MNQKQIDYIFNNDTFEVYIKFLYDFSGFKDIYSMVNYYERNHLEIYNIINNEEYFEQGYSYNNFKMKYSKINIKDRYFDFIKDKKFVCDRYVEPIWTDDFDAYIVYKIK